MIAPLEVTSRDLDQHLAETTRVLVGATAQRYQAHLVADVVGDALAAGLVGADCEPIQRNVGGQTNVIPFVPLQGQLLAWLGYRENWRIRHGRGKSREFRSASLSVYFGLAHDSYKPQVFRAEWAGWAKWDGASYAFQSDAGHPHWQIDALDSLGEDSATLREQALQALQDADDDEPVREFTPRSVKVRNLVLAQGLSRVHFPSAAAWWRPAPQNGHAFAPENPMQLRSWLGQTLRYMKSELSSLRDRRRA